MIRRIFFLLFVSLFSVNAQSVYSEKDVDVCRTKFDLAVSEDLTEKPINEVVIAIGKSFIGLPYESHSLETGGTEKLVIHLTGLDCYTFLESSLVFARCIKMTDATFDCYQKELQKIRYRNGEIKDYTSRLHYFTDWIYEMDKRGIAEDVTKKIGGIHYKNKVNFMSTHPDAYEQLKGNREFIDKMIDIEKDISSRDYYYIPQDSIKKYEADIQSGDIIGITTNIKGLDISHTGIAIRMNDGRIHLLHAPNVGKKVQISEKPLAEYIQSVKQQTGIMVVRPEEIECNN